MRPLYRRLATVTTVAVTVTIALALPAAAHVTVNPESAERGDFEALTFRMPNERPDAASTKLEVTFPEEHPLAFFSVKPHPGWTYRVEKRTLPKPLDVFGTKVTEVVDTVTWTATDKDSAVAPGEYDEFSVSAGVLPEADQMVFKAVQTYDSGEVVRWIEVAAKGAEEPEHPAPVLTLTAPPGEAAAGGGSTTDAEPASRASVNTALGLSGVALVVGLGAGVLGGLALARARRGAAVGTVSERSNVTVGS